ncbi:hypothetical protein AgCh_021132 [Apium graveolens]
MELEFKAQGGIAPTSSSELELPRLIGASVSTGGERMVAPFVSKEMDFDVYCIFMPEILPCILKFREPERAADTREFLFYLIGSGDYWHTSSLVE